MEVVARYGQGWITFGDPLQQAPTVDSLTSAVLDQQALLAAACGQAGRDPDELSSYFLSGGSGIQRLDSMSDFETLFAWCQELKFTDLVFHDPRPGDPQWPGDPGILEGIAADYLGN